MQHAAIPYEMLQIISPAGFEKYFGEILSLFAEGKPDPEKILPVARRYGLELDPASIPALCAKYGLVFG